MSSYGALWRARVRLMRPGNAAMAALGVLVGIALAAEPGVGAMRERWTAVVAAPLAAFLVTGFGNVLNDIRDRDVDRVAHPRRPLPAGEIRLADAQAWAALLLGMGLLEAWVAGGVGLLAFAAGVAVLLFVYEFWAKARGVVGNVVVAVLVGATFVFGGEAWAGGSGRAATLPLAVMAALATLARELRKDAQDAAGDRGHRRTLPHQAPRTAHVLAMLAVGGAVAYSVGAAVVATWPTGAVAVLAAADAVLVAGVLWPAPGQGQRLLKLGMLLAMAAFLAAAV